MNPPNSTSAAPKGAEQQDDSKPSLEMASVSAKTEIHNEGKDHLKDNVEFIRRFEQISTPERQKLWAQVAEWEKESNLPALRAAGLNREELEKGGPLERHIRLAAMVLKRLPGTDELAFTCDFNGSEFAETELDVSDVMPANVITVDILDQNGKVIFEDAERGIKDGKPGYFTKPDKKRAFLRSGFTLKVKGTQSSIALTNRKEGAQAHRLAVAESVYMNENSLKESLGDKVRSEAEKQGKNVYTDREFTDKTLGGVIKEAAESGVLKNGKLDFTKLGEIIENLIAQFGTIFSDLTKSVSAGFEKKEDKKLANLETSDKPTETPPEDQAPKPDELPDNEQSGNLPKHPKDRKVVETARHLIGSTNFRGYDVAGGSLACAKVASTILNKAGVPIPVALGVDVTKRKLLQAKWEMHKGPAQAGDVVVWGKTPTRMVNGVAKAGHGHIGVMTGPNYAVHNIWDKKMPLERKINLNSPRGLVFLRPPHRSSKNVA